MARPRMDMDLGIPNESDLAGADITDPAVGAVYAVPDVPIGEDVPPAPPGVDAMLWEIYHRSDKDTQKALFGQILAQRTALAGGGADPRGPNAPQVFVDASGREITPDEWERMPPGSARWPVGLDGRRIGFGEFKPFSLDWEEKYGEWVEFFCRDPEQRYIEWNGIRFETPFGDAVRTPAGVHDAYMNNWAQHKANATAGFVDGNPNLAVKQRGLGGLNPDRRADTLTGQAAQLPRGEAA